ncbi:hypothetical protein J2T60_001302 [Natronospira proteinivora]|uniref:Uncharacterized protein n=1 Tax=Natronospira proteinivora TaxID=1807133 RepID=A0ABT1G7Q4_9GAMM|nr:hypothetical protein [Natronospira proteinivora]MCP1727337.1 hypothetical protein [Natronospira proteinivora]
MTDKNKRYGIRITMPGNDPLAMPHLLGEDWESFRWYETEEERNRALEDIPREHQFSRSGDRPSIHCEPVDR